MLCSPPRANRTALLSYRGSDNTPALMETKKIIKIVRDLSRPFRITKGKDFRLKDVDPNDTLEFT